MLLPVPETEEGEQGEDPRRDLVQQLIEYQRYKEAGLALRALEEARSQAFARASLGPEEDPRRDYPLEVSLFDLVAAMRRVMEALPKTDRVTIEPDALSVTQRIAELLELLAPGEEVPFEELFRGSREVADVVVTFLAILELVRLRLLRVRQVDAYGAIFVVTVPGGGEGSEGIEPPGDAAAAPGEEEETRA
jgi:segregation and condensation protein A